jgi:zinc-binding dehydrogenase
MTGWGAVVRSAQVCPGDSVAVISAGGVGLCVLQAAYNLGAYPIIVVDLTDEKIAFAKTFGASRSGDTVPPCPLHRSVTGQHHEPRVSGPEAFAARQQASARQRSQPKPSSGFVRKSSRATRHSPSSRRR